MTVLIALMVHTYTMYGQKNILTEKRVFTGFSSAKKSLILR